MFYFTYGGIEYRVRFAHFPNEEGFIQGKFNARPYHGLTTCIVERKAGVLEETHKIVWEMLLMDSSYRSAFDKNFEKRIGRQHALRRIGKGVLDKDFKRAMFGAVYKMLPIDS